MKFQLATLLATGALVPLSFLDAPFPEELVLQHVPTVVGLIGLAIALPYLKLSEASFACLIVFTLLHILGARWIYSFVPYDAWSIHWTGTSLSEHFGWERNHYDRLVHFASGLLGVPPAAEVLQRFWGMRPRGAAIMGIATMLAIGAIYEILEWQIAVTLSPEHAEAYNGQQGDVWDPQKDLAAAWLGATLAAGLVFRRSFPEDGQ
jgi:putative membrane protein